MPGSVRLAHRSPYTQPILGINHLHPGCLEDFPSGHLSEPAAPFHPLGQLQHRYDGRCSTQDKYPVYQMMPPLVACKEVMRLLSEVNGISCTRGNRMSSSVLSRPAFAAATTSAP